MSSWKFVLTSLRKIVSPTWTGRLLPTLAPLLMIFFGMPLSMIPAGKLLGSLDRRHLEIRGLPTSRGPAPWRRSMRDTVDEGPKSVLAVVMVLSVALAFVALAIWFFFFAGSSLPT